MASTQRYGKEYPTRSKYTGDCRPGHQTTGKIADIGQGTFHTKQRNEIRGSGYVIDSLEAALWCFYQTETYRDAILLAANLGDDADTTAAVCGQIAGAHYGYDPIPKEWKERLYMHETIVRLADQLGCSGINPD